MRGESVVVVGIGTHPWGKFPDKSFVDLGSTAVQAALDDAGVAWSDVPAMVSGIYVWGGTDALNAGHAIGARFGFTGIPITNIFNMCATATSALRSAYHVVASGEQEMCLAVGVDVSPKGFFGFMGKPDPQDTDYLRFRLVGLTNPGYWAIETRKRMAEFGTTERHLALAKVACSKHGSQNPAALFKKAYTEEEVLNSPLVADPLRLLEICATRDGAAAVLLCSKSKARQLTVNPIHLAGVGLGSCMQGDPTVRLGTLAAQVESTPAPRLSESVAAAQMAYHMSGVGPGDVDLVELPDNSSWHYLQYIETLGLCDPGDADGLLERGETQIGGKIPVCPSGGASSYGEAISAQGLLQVCDVVTQLRGDAGQRQVEGARVGLAQTYGQLGNSSTAILVS